MDDGLDVRRCALRTIRRESDEDRNVLQGW